MSRGSDRVSLPALASLTRAASLAACTRLSRPRRVATGRTHFWPPLFLAELCGLEQPAAPSEASDAAAASLLARARVRTPTLGASSAPAGGAGGAGGLGMAASAAAHIDAPAPSA